MTPTSIISAGLRRGLAGLLIAVLVSWTLAPGAVAAANAAAAKKPKCPTGRHAVQRKKRVRGYVKVRVKGKLRRKRAWVRKKVWVCVKNTPVVAKGDTLAPTTPSGLTAAAGSGQVTLAWNVASDNVGVTGYQVLRDGQVVTTTPSAFHKDTGLANGTTYAYAVRAVDAAGNASAPATVSVTPKQTSDLTAPTAPGGFTATPGDRQVTLSWQASSDDVGVANYELFRDGASIAFGTARSFTDVSLVNGTSYAYKVVAYDAAGNVSAASTVSATPADVVAPTAPANLAATPGDGQVSLTWTASTDNVGVTGYRVYRGGVLVASPTTPYVVDSGLVNNTTYSYTVVAVDAAGNASAAAGPVPGTPAPPAAGDLQAPSVPAGLAGVAGTNQAQLAWNASTDNVGVTGYRVYRGGVLVGSPAGPSFTDTGLANGTAYSYTVVAVDAAGNASAASAPVSITPRDTQAPTTPTGLAVTLNAAAHSITITWNPSTDNVGVVRYRVWRNGTQIAQPTGTSYTDVDLANKSTYSYTVAAVDAAGNVSPQAPALSTYVS